MEASPRRSEDRTVDPASEHPPNAAGESVPEALGEELRGFPELPDGITGDLDDRMESYAELRPPRRLRLIQLAPIVILSLLGSLMFAFPLAFAFDEAGPVVAMLGLLIGCSAAGWGMMAARRVGYTWPGLPPRGSGHRPAWRILGSYGLAMLVLAALAVWRVAALR
ncbi:hypothetical protein PJ985_14825 [Streptomyces sp. ACA25]|uniref:hypothetical protein n=1 Tax=Streptomyces sp. ACA25 TaxID=3022596 RepID=UPI0023080BD3|nr:hypothetical protein [Streptomyces sp. ACA25]MDB1088840.1 hypothetical protein [Streptomyces sp. ACA25]